MSGPLTEQEVEHYNRVAVEKERKLTDPGILQEAPKRKRGRPPKDKSFATVAPERKCGRPRKELVVCDDGFANGLKFFLAKFSSLIGTDPIAMNQALSDVALAERGYTPPLLIRVGHVSSPVSWRDEYIRVKSAYRHRGPEVARARTARGRPAFIDLEWREVANNGEDQKDQEKDG